MAKLVEGQLNFLNMVSSLSFSSNSMMSSTVRRFVRDLNTAQELYPDTVSRFADVKPVVEANTGKIVSSIA